MALNEPLDGNLTLDDLKRRELCSDCLKRSQDCPFCQSLSREVSFKRCENRLILNAIKVNFTLNE